MDIRSAEFIVFDVETTGLSATGGDRIVEIAALKVKEGKITDEFYSLVNPKRALSPEAMMINQVTEEMVANAPSSDVILPKLIDFIGGGCVAGHNVRFDLGFVGYELALIGRRIKDETPVIDTLKMSRELLPYLSNHKLAYIARSLGVNIGETHRAMADVKLTVAVLLRLMDMAAEKNFDKVGKFLDQFGVEKPVFKLTQVSQTSLF